MGGGGTILWPLGALTSARVREILHEKFNLADRRQDTTWLYVTYPFAGISSDICPCPGNPAR